jgi:hypothetical protein
LSTWSVRLGPGRRKSPVAQNSLFTLEPWRHVGGAVQDHKLAIRGVVSEATLRSALVRVKAFDVVRVRARVAE